MDNIKPDAVEHGLSQTSTESGSTGNTGNAFASAVESVMDVSPGLRFIGTLAGLESPAMRREKRAEQMGNIALARAQADFEDYQNMRPMRNQLAIQSLYEQQYRATVDPIAERISRGVAKEYGQLQMSPKAWNQWKESQSYKDLVATQTAFGMLKDNNPAVVRAGTEYARRLGVNISQQDGKTYFDAPTFGVRGELTPETEKQFIELGEKLAMQDAAAIEKMEQRKKRIDGYVMNKAVNRLIAKTGMAYGEAYQRAEGVFSQFDPKDMSFAAGILGGKDLMQGGLLPEERQEFEMQLDFIRKGFDITVAQDEKGNIFIEGKPAMEWFDQQIENNPVVKALREMEDEQVAAAKLRMEARAARKNGIPAEAAPPTVEEREQQAQAQAGKELAEANGMTDWGRTIADRFNRGKAEKDQITPEQALAILGRAYTGWENAMLTTNDPDTAYKAVVKAFQGFGLGESYIPDFFKKAGEDINYENAEAEYKSAKEAARKVPPPTRKQQKIRAAQIEDTRQWRHIAQQSFGFGDPFMPGWANNALAIASLSAPEATPPEVSRLQKARDTFAKAKSRRENREAEEAQARAAQEKNRKKREELRNRLMNKKK